MPDISIVIPSRNEMFLAKTVENILENIQGDTEVIAVCDGGWTDPPIKDDPRVTILNFPKAIGQRAAANRGVSISRAKYIIKCDAHCAFDKGFDVKMMKEMHDDWTMAPLMKNLHAFDWVCKKCGFRKYQGPTPVDCPKCDNKTDFYRDVIWHAKKSPNSVSYCFDDTLHFQYFSAYSKRPEGSGEVTESMSLQGSFFMLTREKYWELNVCDESFGFWGQQGVEVACKTWLSGGKVMINKKTYYAHMFRTQGGDFGFPYPLRGHDVEKTRNISRDLFYNNKWDKQKYPLSWLIDRFAPVPSWHPESSMLKKVRETGVNFKTFEINKINEELIPIASPELITNEIN